MYKRKEVEKETLNYFKGDTLATSVWIDKYALKDKEGNLLEKSPDDMHRRLAKEFVRIEQKYPNPIPEEEIYGLMKDFKYIIPQGSPMFGVGNSYQLSSLGNCFVIGESDSDSYSNIMRRDEEQAHLMK